MILWYQFPQPALIEVNRAQPDFLFGTGKIPQIDNQ